MDYITHEGKVIEPPRKQLFRIQIPFVLRFSLIWTIFFAILGIAIQSLQAKVFIFKDFFTINYMNWFASFGNFSQLTQYASVSDLLWSLFGRWYYFFLTGGLISLLWGLISWIIHIEFIFKRSDKEKPLETKENIEQIKKNIIEKPAEIVERNYYLYDEKQDANLLKEKKIEENLEKINEWLAEGLFLLSEGNLEEAELIYKSLRQEYKSENDSYGILQRRIHSFYEEIMAERKDRGL